MINNALPHILRFFGLIIFQVLILHNITLHGLVNPYIYPLFIFSLPFDTPKWLTILLGFLLGLGIDLFTYTIGIHAAASTFIAFIRPFVINMLTPTGGYELEDKPNLRSLGITWILPYTAILIFMHHTSLMLLEFLSFTPFLFITGKILLSSVVSLTLIIIYHYLFFPKR